MIDLESQSQAMRRKKDGNSRLLSSLAIASFIMRYLGWQARNRIAGVATIRSSGWPLRNRVIIYLTK
jgi:hypothetical protein